MNHEVIEKINKHLFDTITTWLPDVKISSQGYQACNPIRGDKNPSSMTIYPDGKAFDFAANQSLDCINLWAEKNQMNNNEAIKFHAEQLGINSANFRHQNKKPNLKVFSTAENQKELPPEPYPTNAFTHHKYGSPSFVYTYYAPTGELIGYTCRFDLSDGSKVVLPFTWSNIIGKNSDGSPKQSSKPSWHWNSHGWNGWPIYGAEKLLKNNSSTVLICEGEKTALAAQSILKNCVVISWAGGTSKANKVDWSLLQDRNVVIWPDADSKTDRSGNLLPWYEQPGFKAALDVSKKLHEVNTYPKIVIPPQNVKDGWDLADAKIEGWTAEQVLEYITRSSYSEEEAEKLLGPRPNTLKKAHQSKTVEQELLFSDLKVHNELIVVKYLKNYKGESKPSIDVPDTIENYLLQFKSINKEPEVQNQKVKIKKILQQKTFKSLLTQIWCDCDKTLKGSATKDAIENHFSNIMENKRIETLKSLQDKMSWDGTDFETSLKIISLWFAHALSNETNILETNLNDFKPAVLAFMHFIWQVKRKLFGYQAEMHMAPIFLGEQGNGKSEFIRNISNVLNVPFFNLVRDAYVDEIGEEKNEAILAQSFINILDEMAGTTRAELNKVKNFITRHTVNPREFHSQRTMGEMSNLSTFIGAANAQNLSEILHDESGNRRFFPIKVIGFLDKKINVLKPEYKMMCEKLSWVLESGECFPHQFDSLPLWKMIDHEWPCFVRNDAIKEVQSEHQYNPVKQWLENFSAEVIPEEQYKSSQRRGELKDTGIELVSVGFLRELFLSMYKPNVFELKKWSIQKFSLSLQNLGISTWKNNERGKFHKYMVVALKADWSQVDQKLKDRLL